MPFSWEQIDKIYSELCLFFFDYKSNLYSLFTPVPGFNFWKIIIHHCVRFSFCSKIMVFKSCLKNKAQLLNWADTCESRKFHSLNLFIILCYRTSIKQKSNFMWSFPLQHVRAKPGTCWEPQRKKLSLIVFASYTST